jgi:hypothetical protein
MDERVAFQRMRRVQLGSDVPIYANLGRYYEPFEEIVAPISSSALDAAFPSAFPFPLPFPFPPSRPNTPSPSALFEIEGPVGGTASSPQLLEIEEDISPVRTSLHPSQVFSTPTAISPASALDYPTTPAGPSGIAAEPDVTWIGSAHTGHLDSIDSAKRTEEYTEDTTEGEYEYAECANEEAGYAAASGPPNNQRGQRSIRRTPEEAAPYTLERDASKRAYKPRIVTNEDDFPHPSIPNPDGARQQADYNAGKLKWWSLRVLRPLLSASPKPLSKNAILSIIKEDLGLNGDAWKAFHDEHLVKHNLRAF